MAIPALNGDPALSQDDNTRTPAGPRTPHYHGMTVPALMWNPAVSQDENTRTTVGPRTIPG